MIADAARALIDSGLSLVPLVPGGKRPIGAWRQRQKVRLGPEHVEPWWGGALGAGLGIITGKISQGIVVLDIEPEHVAYVEQTVEGLEVGGSRSAVTTARGGRHYYFRGDVGCGKLRVGNIVVGDVRGNGGLVVAPPTTTPSGQYQWAQPWRGVDHLAELPEWARPGRGWLAPGTRTGTGWVDGRTLGSAHHHPTPVPVRVPVEDQVTPQHLLAWLPSSLLRAAVEGWRAGGSFSSSSELHFAVVREAIYGGADLDSIEELFDTVPALGDEAAAHAEDYLTRTYAAAMRAVEACRDQMVSVRCLRVFSAAGQVTGGARERAFLDLVSGQQSYQWQGPVRLGPPYAGQLAGEWLQVCAAFGLSGVGLDGFKPRRRAQAVVDGGRVVRWVA
jgi:hypothetical protein